MQRQVPGDRDQATTNKTPLNADNEDNVTVLGEKYFFGNSMEITSLKEFSYESHNEDNIDINYINKERQTQTNTLNTAVIECYCCT